MLPVWKNVLSSALRFAHSLQVKYQGQYPPRRLHEFAAYQHETSTCRAVKVLLLSMVPCLIVSILVDAIPLNSPDLGAKHNKLFFARLTIGYWITGCLGLMQFRHIVPALQLSNVTLVLLSAIIALAIFVALKGFVEIVGFPLPYTLHVGYVPWVPCMLVGLASVGIRKIVKSERYIRHLANAIRVWAGQFAMIIAWPLYFTAVLATPTMVRPVTMLLVLPLMKLALRHGFSRALPHLREEGPEVVTFNADVFSSLFLTASTNSSSMLFTAGLWIVDGVWAILHIRDIRKMSHEIASYEAAIRARKPEGHQNLAWEGSQEIEVRFGLVDRTELILTKVRRQLPATKRYSVAPLTSLQSKRRIVRLISSEGAMMKRMEGQHSGLKISQMANTLTTDKGWSQRKRLKHSVMPTQPENRKGTRSRISVEELAFTERAQQVLYTMEHIVLLSYIEAVVPLIYGAY